MTDLAEAKHPAEYRPLHKLRFVAAATVGNAYDNAMAESFFATLECELIDRRSWQTKTEARRALFTHIEGSANEARLRCHGPIPANLHNANLQSALQALVR